MRTSKHEATLNKPTLEPDEEWDKSDAVGVCDRCGKKKPVIFRSDPFLSEVYNEESEPCNWCYVCWIERKDDI